MALEESYFRFGDGKSFTTSRLSHRIRRKIPASETRRTFRKRLRHANEI
jgi:hypothetical protein